MRYKGRYTYLGLDMQNSRVTREQGRESKDIHYGLGLTAVMLDEKQGWREKLEEMCSDWCFRKVPGCTIWRMNQRKFESY